MKTIHIAPGREGFGLGTSTQPMLVSSASEFDQLLRLPGPVRYLLHPGEYETRGAWAFESQDYCALKAGCELIGLGGSKGTRISLCPHFEKTMAGKPAFYMETFIAGSRSGACDHLVIEGITLDCTCPNLRSSGIHTHSSNAIIRDVRVTGISGDWVTLVEGFGILVNNAPQNTVDGGNLIENCSVSGTGPLNYANGIYCGCKVRGRMVQNVVRDCKVDWDYSADWAKKPHTAYAANGNTLFDGCHADGFERWFFCDTDDIGDVIITGCTGDLFYCILDFPAPADRGILYRRNILVSDCIFKTTRPSTNHAILLLLKDFSKKHDIVALENVRLRGVIWEMKTGTGSPDAFAVSVQGSKARNIQLVDCILPEKCFTSEGVFPPTPAKAVGFGIPESSAPAAVQPKPGPSRIRAAK